MTSYKAPGKTAVPDTRIQYIRAGDEPAIFKAKWVIKDPWTILENAGIALAAGRITSVLETVPSGPSVTDCGPGILMPPLVNAHMHLELSALANRLPLGKGFEPWVKALLTERDSWAHLPWSGRPVTRFRHCRGRAPAWWERSPP